jgi:hypothetical protein
VRDAERVDLAVEGSAMPLTCRPMPRAAALRSRERIAHLRDKGAVEIKTLVVVPAILTASE